MMANATGRYTSTYEELNRRRTVTTPAGHMLTYSYDSLSRRSRLNTPAGVFTYSYDNNNRQTRVVNPQADRTTTTWDYENRTSLILLPGATRNTMAYEPEELRVRLEDSAGSKLFLWEATEAADRSGRIKAEGGSINYLAELDSSNITTALYTNEPQQYGNLISQRRGTTTKWYHYETLGSTRELTDASRDITDTYLYDAWGNVLTSTGTTKNPFRYVGQLGYSFDPDTGRYYIRARIYDPVVGRWTSVDLMPFVDGANLYAAYFVPNGTDPTGKKIAVCCRPTNIPVAGALGYDHCWLKTDTEAAGRGPENKCCNSCICARTQQTDHTNDTPTACHPPQAWYPTGTAGVGATRELDTCNEACVNSHLNPGAEVGRFVPLIADCTSFVMDVLRKCCTFKIVLHPTQGGEFGMW